MEAGKGKSLLSGDNKPKHRARPNQRESRKSKTPPWAQNATSRTHTREARYVPFDFKAGKKTRTSGGKVPASKKRRSDGASYWRIPPTCGESRVKKMHMSGKLGRSATEPQIANRCQLVPYRTDYYVSIRSFFAVPHTCSQAALVLATGIDLRGLGIQWMDPKGKMKKKKFSEMNEMLQQSSGLGQLFVLSKLCPGHLSNREVFRLKAGVYIIHSCWYEPEDVENCEDEIDLKNGTESFPHYVVYNAGTGVLYLNPDVIVVEESDKSDPDFFCKQLLKEFGARFPSERNWLMTLCMVLPSGPIPIATPVLQHKLCMNMRLAM